MILIPDHDNLVTDEAKFLKKNCWPEFWSLVFLEIGYNDSWQQYLISSRGKTHWKNFGGPKLGQTSQNWPEMRFFAIFSSLVHYFSLKLHTMIAGNNVELKPTKKIGGPNSGQNLGPKLGFLLFSQVLFISFPLRGHP